MFHTETTKSIYFAKTMYVQYLFFYHGAKVRRKNERSKFLPLKNVYFSNFLFKSDIRL